MRISMLAKTEKAFSLRRGFDSYEEEIGRRMVQKQSQTTVQPTFWLKHQGRGFRQHVPIRGVTHFSRMVLPQYHCHASSSARFWSKNNGESSGIAAGTASQLRSLQQALLVESFHGQEELPPGSETVWDYAHSLPAILQHLLQQFLLISVCTSIRSALSLALSRSQRKL